MAVVPALVTVFVWGVSADAAGCLMADSLQTGRALRRTPGVRFVKVLGTAAGGRMRPTDADLRHWAVLVSWDTARAADGFAGSRLARAFDARAYERLAVHLRPVASRGRWSGREPFGDPVPTRVDTPGPVASLTRARLAPTRMVRFYRAAGPVAADLAGRDGLLLALGIGEAPLGLQGTFSLWRSAADLAAFAHRGPAHLDAVRRTPREGWYAEELFARFAVLGVSGRYQGRPVAGPWPAGLPA
ncbi:MAG: monooxygenase [Acidimicrobiia bacterium]